MEDPHLLQGIVETLHSHSTEMTQQTYTFEPFYMSNSQKVAIFFIPFLIDYLQIYVIDVHS